jgi:multiple sugar transport system ATP-binding protein
MAALTIRNLRKTYAGGVEVLRGIDLSIADGEFAVFVGPSGCGKSTLLRMIAGLEDISAGELLIDGVVVNHLPPSQRGISMVFQSYALYPHMTVAENMGFALKLAGMPKAQVAKAVGDVAEILQITKLLDRKPKALSGGQRQRVAIGRAIVRSPKVFLFDEPLSNLDAGLRVQMRIELSKLHKELGTTMIYVTHDQVEAMTLGDRIAVFNQGLVEQVGSPLELYEHPHNQFVASFLGAPRMNFMLCEPLATGPSNVVRTGESIWTTPCVVSQSCVAGVRPEDLTIGEAGQGLKAQVELVEHLGDTVLVHTKLLGTDTAVSLRTSPVAPRCERGNLVYLVPDPRKTHFFSNTGVRLDAQTLLA